MIVVLVDFSGKNRFPKKGQKIQFSFLEIPNRSTLTLVLSKVHDRGQNQVNNDWRAIGYERSIDKKQSDTPCSHT